MECGSLLVFCRFSLRLHPLRHLPGHFLIPPDLSPHRACFLNKPQASSLFDRPPFTKGGRASAYMPKNCWILAILLLRVFPAELHAASSAHYTVDKLWMTEDGLPGNAIISMTQTRDGYLWLGTQAGLVRFDGIGHVSAGGRVEFTVFDESNGLSARTIVKLFEDKRGNLWIGTEADGILVVNQDDKVIHIGDLGLGKPAERLKAICEDRNG